MHYRFFVFKTYSWFQLGILILTLLLAACGSSNGEDSGNRVNIGAGFNHARGLSGSVRTIALATDGSGDVYIGGDFIVHDGVTVSHLARFNSDGSLDAAFDMSGGGANGVVSAIVPATDGSGDVYVGGRFDRLNGTPINNLARLNSDGSVDTRFDMGGGGANDAVFAIAPALDGSGDVYVGGYFTGINGTTSNHLARLNSDGSVDSAFDMSGGGANYEVDAIATVTDNSGKVYVGGWFTSINGSKINRLARLNSDGSVDSTFGTSAGGADFSVNAIALARDGSGDVYVGGLFTSFNNTASNLLARLNSDGSVDTAFSMSGSYVYAIVAAADNSGDVYIGGRFDQFNGANANNLVRLNSDNSVDLAFDMSVGGADNVVYAIATTTDGGGDVYVGGEFTRVQGTAINRLARLNSDGSVDTAFDIGGGGVNNEVYTVAPALDDSGDVYVGGIFTSINGTTSNHLARLNSDGSVDTAFDMSGGGANFEVTAIAPAIDGSGDVYVSGWFTSLNGTTSNYLARLNSDGSVDTDFDMSGGGANAAVLTIATATDGSGDVYVGGNFTSLNGATVSHLARLNKNGSVDMAFDMSNGPSNNVYTIVPSADASGDIYIGGDFLTINGMGAYRLARLKADGSINTTFDMSKGGTEGPVTSIALAKDGSGDVYVGGEFTFLNSETVGYFARLNSDGSLDKGFDISGGGANASVTSIIPAIDGSGDVYVGGYFSAINGTSVFSLARLNSDGSVDKTFDTNTNLQGYVLTLAAATDNSTDIFIGGDFTSFKGITTGSLVRLNSDGSVD